MADNSVKNSEGIDHHNQGGLIAFLGSMVFVFVFFFYVGFLHKGIDLGENVQDPAAAGAVEKKEVDISQIAEPWVPNEDMVTAGAKIYAQNCALCHGAEGKGDGPSGGALNPKPRNLVTGPWKKGGGYVGVFTVLQEGLPGSSMASYAHFKPADRWALTQFVNSITEAKVEEDPAKVAEFAKTAK